MKINHYMLLAITASTFLTACYSARFYSGDGHLADNTTWGGTWIYGDIYGSRYVLDLGSVDLAVKGVKTFRLKGLPKWEFCLGIALEDDLSKEAGWTERLINNINPLVSIQLSEASGKTVFTAEGYIKSWTWGGANEPGAGKFVYVRKQEDSDLKSTYFTPETDKQYVLTFSVIEPDAEFASGYEARLVAK